jgi:adenylate kinase
MILLMGIQGSGKGTQGSMLAEKFGYKLLSMGDLIRAKATDEQRARVLGGNLLQDEETASMIDQVLSELPKDQEYILDGFPRSIPQAEWLVAEGNRGRFTIDHIIHLTASREAVKSRLLRRGRSDDKDDAIEKRFNLYERSTDPLFAWFRDHGLVVNDVNAERSVAEVNEDLVKLINQE